MKGPNWGLEDCTPTRPLIVFIPNPINDLVATRLILQQALSLFRLLMISYSNAVL